MVCARVRIPGAPLKQGWDPIGQWDGGMLAWPPPPGRIPPAERGSDKQLAIEKSRRRRRRRQRRDSTPPPPPPRCQAQPTRSRRCSDGPRSSTSTASSTSGRCETTRSARPLRPPKPRGNSSHHPDFRADGQTPYWESMLTAATTHRQALRYMVRNTTLPARTRAMAQLELTQMHAYTRPTQIKNRCIMGTKGRGILRDFKMSRVRPALEISWC